MPLLKLIIERISMAKRTKKPDSGMCAMGQAKRGKPTKAMKKRMEKKHG